MSERTAYEIAQALTEPFAACELEYKQQPFPALYVDARTFVARLNKVVPGDWEFDLMPEVRFDVFRNASRDGVLTIHFPNGARRFSSVGTETGDYRMDKDGAWLHNNAEPKSEKGADSDTFKRCCFRAGIGAYVYELPKSIQRNALTFDQVKEAARMAGYEGEIKEAHFGSLLKSRVTTDGENASSASHANVAPKSGNPANGNGQRPSSVASQVEDYGGDKPHHALLRRAMNWKFGEDVKKRQALLAHLGVKHVSELSEGDCREAAAKLGYSEAASPGALVDVPQQTQLSDAAKGFLGGEG